MSVKKVWVLGWDYGHDGKSDPEIAFFSEQEAKAAAGLIETNPSATRCYIAEVPMWSVSSVVSYD